MNAGESGGRGRSDVAAEQPSVGSRVVESAWVAIVAAVSARSRRRAARHSHAGLVVVCDRWLVDALVDIEILYGRHRLAEWVLRRATPRADLAVLLEIDPATAARRKPGDQSEGVLERMAVRYAAVANELGFPPAGDAPRAGKVRIDARAGQADVVAAIDAQLDALAARRPVSL